MDEDLLLAIQLQEQFDHEYDASLFSSSSFDDDSFGQKSKRRKVDAAGGGGVALCSQPAAQPDRPLSIVDEAWEVLDPSPDVRAMFLEFNDMFFWGKLSGIEVKWSPRMTLCAGVCSYEGHGGLCSIRLSEPLLKLRARKDLVETLLHEMIHALLFVTQNNRDRDGHGPEFCKHMKRINEASGTNITVYHTFHDEVDLYRQHWWRCDGPCQNRRPYFGYVKRAMNRAPSALDRWWADHQRTCGGSYTKIKEPEGYGKKGKTGGNPEKKIPEKKEIPEKKASDSGLQDIRNIIPFSGKGFLLGGKSPSSTSFSPSHKAPGPVVKTSLSSPISPPRNPLFSRPCSATSLPPSVCSGMDNPAKGISSTVPSIRSGASGGQKPPIKKSVSNTKVFVSINGSPVKIPKPHSSSGSRGTVKPFSSRAEILNTKQRSIQDVFNSRGLKTAESRSTVSIPPVETKREVPSSPGSREGTASASSLFSKQSNRSSFPPTTSKPSTSKADHSKYSSVVETGTKPRPPYPLQSKYFNDSSSDRMSEAAGGGAASRKRLWDDRSSSANIFDLFQKTVGTESGATRESVRTKSPAVQQSTVAAASSSASSSSSSSSLMVSCPVCQAKVQESDINLHLDSCLS